MAQGDVHDNHGTYSAFEYAPGKYAMPVTLVPGIPSADVAGTEVQGTSAAGSTSKQGNPVRLGAKYKATAATRSDGETSDLVTDVNENLKTTLGTLQAGEDLTNDVQKVEQRYSYVLVAADTLIKTGAGFLHTITFSCNDAAPTAGSLIVYDNTAESGTQIFNHTFTTTPFAPCSVIIDASFGTGLYAGFTTTADVNVTFSYR